MMQDGPDTSAELQGHAKYKKVKDLNSGAHGVVVLAEEKGSNEKVAIKLIKRGPEMKGKYALREILNHRSLIHPHVVQFKEVFLTENCLAIVMEYCSGGDMLEYVVKRNGLPEASSRWFFQQLVLAVDYLHKMGFASRDIKLDNVLLDKSRKPLLKLCDFGYSKHMMDSMAGSVVGTPAYLAPEVIRADDNTPYNPQLADIWCCGVFLYASTIGTYPFYRPQDRGNPKEVQIMIKRILRMEYKIPEGGKVSEGLRDLLSKILVEDPQQRISMRGIMRHPWFLKDLPEGVLEMNEDLPEPGDDVQALEDVEKIMNMAAVPVRSAFGSGPLGSPSIGTTQNPNLSVIPESIETKASENAPNTPDQLIGSSVKEPLIESPRMTRNKEVNGTKRNSRRKSGEKQNAHIKAINQNLNSIDREHSRGSIGSQGSDTGCLPCMKWSR